MRVLVSVLLAWLAATAIACVAVFRTFGLHADAIPARPTIASVWDGGRLVARASLSRVGENSPALDEAVASRPSSTLVYETVVATGPVITTPEAVLGVSLVPGQDGIQATIGARTEFLTP